MVINKTNEGKENLLNIVPYVTVSHRPHSLVASVSQIFHQNNKFL